MYIIKEKIYGNMATVFHRTSVSDLVNKVYTEGFKPGYGDFYCINNAASFTKEDVLAVSHVIGRIITKS